MLGSNWGTCYCSLGMFGKYLNTALMINKYWEQRAVTALCVEEREERERRVLIVGCLERYVEILTVCTGAHCTTPHWARTGCCKYLLFLRKLDQQSRWMECLTFLFVMWRWVESASFTLSRPQLSSLSSLPSLCTDWFYTSLPTWYVASCCT